MGRAPHDDEDGILDEEKSDSDPEEAYTAVRSVVSIPKQAAEEAQENPKVAELKERLINAYPRLFSGVANKNPPHRGRFGTARIKVKPNPKIYRHWEYQLQGDRAVAMKKLLAEFIERGSIEPSDSEWASPAFIVPKKEKGEWRLVVDYRGLNEQTEHESYSLPLIDTILQKQQKKRIFTRNTAITRCRYTRTPGPAQRCRRRWGPFSGKWCLWAPRMATSLSSA